MSDAAVMIKTHCKGMVDPLSAFAKILPPLVSEVTNKVFRLLIG